MTSGVESRAAVLYAAGDLRIETRRVPEPDPGEVLVRVLACGICGSDVHYYREGRIGHFVVDSPMVLGHETAGVVVAAADDSGRELVGSLVAIEPGVPCGRCVQCRRGRYNLCPEVRFFATPPVDGALSEFVAVPAAWVYPAPPGMSAEVAAMAEPVSVGVWACRRARVSTGDRVLVMGAGPVGLFAAQVARARGADVEVFDVNERRLAVAADLGLPTADLSSSGPRYSVLLECSGSQAAADAGFTALAPAARAVLIGMGVSRLSVDLALIQSREIEILGSFRYANTYSEALALLASGKVEAARLITHRFDIEHAAEAFDADRSLPDAVKVVVTVGSES